MTYDELVAPDDVVEDSGSPSRTYSLQDIETTDTAGEVVWESELPFWGDGGDETASIVDGWPAALRGRDQQRRPG